MTSAVPDDSSTRRRVLVLGVVILDVLARPVTRLPPVERAHLLDEVRLTAAGTAAATAVDLVRLGCDVKIAGAVGADAAGALVADLLRRAGVDISGLHRLPGVATSVSVLPITPEGERLAWHVRGANAVFGPEHVDYDALRASVAVHVGGPDVLSAFGRDAVQGLLDEARRHGVQTSMDFLSSIPTIPADWVTQWAPGLDVLSINEHQATVVTGADDGVAAAQVLHGWGVRWAAVTMGRSGCAIASESGVELAPACPVPVVDTTGCGDAFSAALLVARLLGRSPAHAAAFANAAAALVATGLGSDAGLIDAEQVDEFAAAAAARSGA